MSLSKKKKYEFTGKEKHKYGEVLHQIRAVRSFGNIEEGEVGGWIEKELNLSHDGDAWVYGDARICGNAKIAETRQYIVIGPAGRRNDFATFFRDIDGIYVKCGCFTGSIQNFLEKVKGTHGDGKYAKAYQAAARLAEEQIRD